MVTIDLSDLPTTCRILAIDNGTDKVGFTVGDYDIRTGIVDVILCETYQVPSDFRRRHSRTYHDRGSFMARLSNIERYYKALLLEYEPDIIGCESPFGFRQMDPFKKLTLSMQLFDDVTYELYPWVDFVRIAPFEAKKAAAGSRKFSQDKDVVHRYVLSDKKIVFRRHIDVSALGPDALDSVSVAMATVNYVLY